MMLRPTLAVVLAAGEGTRMKSSLPKVLHPIGHRPMLDHVLAGVKDAGISNACVVIGSGAEKVSAHLAKAHPAVGVHVQAERLGTAHALLSARAAYEGGGQDVLMLYGDTPFVSPETINRLRDIIANGADVAFVGFHSAYPFYGRMVTDGDRLLKIAEYKDADEATRAITLMNSGIAAFRAGLLPALLEKIGNNNAKGEYYVTDAVELANQAGLTVKVLIGKEAEFLGINDRVQLAEAEAVFQSRARKSAMLNGTTLTAPETVFFAADTILGRDVTVEPHVVFGPKVRVGDNVQIRAFSHFENAEVASGAIIGPYARLRPGAKIEANAHIGNFVEIKAATISEGAKVNHLTYIGDAFVGARTNVGAGTITCNYDGYFKHRTTIGADVFVGSNTVLVAPVSVGDNALTAAGSVITENVAADAMALGRARQINKPGRGAELKTALKAKKG